MSAADDTTREHAAQMLLTPPEVPTLDALIEWGHRLRAGMKAKFVTHRQANDAWRAAIAAPPVFGGA